MKQLYCYLIICALATFLFSCSAPQYFHDSSSLERQKELRNTRSGNVFTDIMLGVATVCVAATLDTEIDFVPHDQNFKNLSLVNPTNDTLYVNMLTDIIWDKNDYCDFMDIRIPPLKTCKVMVPINASYNLYFSPTPESDDDELMEINTSKIKRITLKPGITAAF